jgi:IS5 family transposase
MVRIDSTVTQALMHAPTDSSLLWDAVRVMVRLLTQASALPGVAPIVWRNHRRLAKKRALAIRYSRGKEQKARLYRDLIAATRATVTALQRAAQLMAACAAIEAELWRGQVRHYLPLIERLISQAERRVLARRGRAGRREAGQPVREHADIIVKGGRDVPTVTSST